MNDDEIANLSRVIAGVLVAIYLFWVFAVPPIMAWLAANAFTLVLIGAVCLVGIVGFGYWLGREGARAAERRTHEREERVRKEREYADLQRQRGLEEYQTVDGETVWVPRDQLEEVARRDQGEAEARKLVNRVMGHIEAFTPSWNNTCEQDYHRELQGYIKAVFPDARVEVQTGSSRPDIVVQNIAIEVKGPTYTRDLQTIADKLMRYSQHYDTVIVVLFDVQVNDRRYEEWERGVKKTFGDVRIICL
jgi:hypothetical protein